MPVTSGTREPSRSSRDGASDRGRGRQRDRAAPPGGPGPGADPPRRQERYTDTVQPLIGALVAVARRILGDEGQAGDAVQEALIGLWLQEPMPANPRAWLTRAVVLRSLHQSRSRARRRRHEAGASRLRPETSERDEPSRAMEWREFAQALDDAIARIPEDFRSVLVMKAGEDLDYAAIAGALQIPVGTVRSRLSRCRRALRQLLPEDSGGPGERDRARE